MRNYIIRRLLLGIPTLFLTVTLVFFLVRFIPDTIVDQMVSREDMPSSISREKIENALGLDVPVHIQYGRFMRRLFIEGDFGDSFYTGLPVMSEIARKLPLSIELGLLAILMALAIGLPIGIYSAVRQDSFGDYLARGLAIIMIALPSFWIGTMVVVLPSVWFRWMPPTEFVPFLKNPLKNLGTMIIPSAILGMVMSGVTMRMTRTMMLEVLRQDYIRTAWAKGLREKMVITRHALKNALLPVITIIGLQFPILIGGAVITEEVFSLPGIGRLTLQTINNRDYPMLIAINLVMAGFVLVLNILVDIAYGFLDPRVQYK